MSYQNSLSSSFRDPSGFLYKKEHMLLRQVNNCYRDNYTKLMQSGLYDELIQCGLLIPHQEVDIGFAATGEAYKIIKPELVEYISYPYEWCFSELKDAALATLKIQRLAIKYGMVLKDASAYNIQFFQGRAMLIDSLSFEQYQEGEPWVAYRQFCQHFLAPLALMRYKDVRMNQLLRLFIDGIPLDLSSKLLPKSSYLKYSLLSHIHLHARTQAHYADRAAKEIFVINKKAYISRFRFDALMESLKSAIDCLQWKVQSTEWGDYYSDTNYADAAMRDKEDTVQEFLSKISPQPKLLQDIGANTGRFSRIAAQMGIFVVSLDIDPAAVEKNYLNGLKIGTKNILPLILDITNPSSSIGWSEEERASFMNRGPVDAIIALALIHHLAITNNVPLGKIADFFARMTNHLIIEFVPKADSQVKRLLATREDIFNNYNQEGFESAFSHYFELVEKHNVQSSQRTLYLMRAH